MPEMRSRASLQLIDVPKITVTEPELECVLGPEPWAWYRSDDLDIGSVDFWPDRVGSRDLVPVGSTEHPLPVARADAINGYPELGFSYEELSGLGYDNQGLQIDFPDHSLANGITVVHVMRGRSFGGNAHMVGFNPANGFELNYEASESWKGLEVFFGNAGYIDFYSGEGDEQLLTPGYHAIIARGGPGVAEVYLDGQLMTGETWVTTTDADFWASRVAQWILIRQRHIESATAELIIYDKMVDQSEIDEVNEYIECRYGIGAP